MNSSNTLVTIEIVMTFAACYYAVKMLHIGFTGMSQQFITNISRITRIIMNSQCYMSNHLTKSTLSDRL